MRGHITCIDKFGKRGKKTAKKYPQSNKKEASSRKRDYLFWKKQNPAGKNPSAYPLKEKKKNAGHRKSGRKALSSLRLKAIAASHCLRFGSGKTGNRSPA